MHKRSSIIFILLFASFLIFSEENYKDLFKDIPDSFLAEDLSADKPKENKTSNMDFKISLTGAHAFEFHIPVIKDNMNFDGYIKSPKIKNEFGIEAGFKNLLLVSHWQFDIILNEWGDIKKFLEMLPMENYVSWSPWKFRFAIGFQNFNWGVSDKINPTDNVNIKDIRHPYDFRKTPVFSVSASFFPFDFMSMEVLYIPFYLQLTTDTVTAQIEDAYPNANVSVKSSINPELFGIGGKLNFFFRYADFSFSYLTQIDPYFSLNLDFEKKSAGSDWYYSISKAELINRRLHHFGTDLKTTAGIFGIWTELCYSFAQDDFLMEYYNIRNHQFKYTLGFDFNYGPNSDFYFNFQYFGNINPFYYADFYKDYKNGDFDLNKDESYYKEFYYRKLTDPLALIREGFLQGVSLKMKWPVLSSLFTPSIDAVYTVPVIYDTNREIRYGTLYVNPEIDIMPLDSFHILVGSDLFFSWHKLDGKVSIDEENLTGFNYKNNNIYLVVKYKWGIDFKK